MAMRGPWNTQRPSALGTLRPKNSWASGGQDEYLGAVRVQSSIEALMAGGCRGIQGVQGSMRWIDWDERGMRVANPHGCLLDEKLVVSGGLGKHQGSWTATFCFSNHGPSLPMQI